MQVFQSEQNKVKTNSTLAFNSMLSIDQKLPMRGGVVIEHKHWVNIHKSYGREQLRFVEWLQQKFTKKKRYHFQILKQFFLFPQSSVESSVIQVNNYDILLFSGESIHTVFKILETKQMEGVIWAFLNLQMMRNLEIAKQFSQKMIKFTRTIVFLHQSFLFSRLKDENVRVLIKQKKESSRREQQQEATKLQKRRSTVRISKAVIDIVIKRHKEISYTKQKREKLSLEVSKVSRTIETERSGHIERVYCDYGMHNASIKSCNTHCQSTCYSQCQVNCCSTYYFQNQPQSEVYNLGQRLRYLKYLQSLPLADSK